jgi:hypothetical protein
MLYIFRTILVHHQEQLSFWKYGAYKVKLINAQQAKSTHKYNTIKEKDRNCIYHSIFTTSTVMSHLENAKFEEFQLVIKL